MTTIINSLNKSGKVLISPGQDVKRYPCGVRLENQKVFRAPGSRIKQFERFFFRSTNNNLTNVKK